MRSILGFLMIVAFGFNLMASDAKATKCEEAAGAPCVKFEVVGGCQQTLRVTMYNMVRRDSGQEVDYNWLLGFDRKPYNVSYDVGNHGDHSTIEWTGLRYSPSSHWVPEKGILRATGSLCTRYMHCSYSGLSSKDFHTVDHADAPESSCLDLSKTLVEGADQVLAEMWLQDGSVMSEEIPVLPGTDETQGMPYKPGSNDWHWALGDWQKVFIHDRRDIEGVKALYVPGAENILEVEVIFAN